jgi:hypothetical protein
MHASDYREPVKQQTVSPFSDAEIDPIRKKKKNSAVPWIICGLVLLVVLSGGGFVLARYLNDPLRVLELFPVSKYMENYKSVVGAKFRADLRVENDLGWKDGIGRLMVFTLREDPHPIVVMIPPNLAQTYFTKGQNYMAELEVKEGGLIYANSCRKN